MDEGKRRIDFKSTPENYRKEYLGLKRNTVRKFGLEPDVREELLNKYLIGELDNLYIRIIKTSTSESFERQVTDVTLFEGIYVISWQ